jgi:hypothetical protein
VIPLDDFGEVIPHDHPNFANGEALIRRISIHHIVPTADGRKRLSSAVFKYTDPDGYLSCDSEKCIIDLDKIPADFVMTDDWLGALIINVGIFREISSPDLPKIGMVPLSDNPCHGAVWGRINSGKSKNLKASCDWLKQIDGVDKE